ncbi:unnamed protein product, partial [Rotaria sp. Silwood1]
MPLQLKYLFIQKFEWLYFVVKKQLYYYFRKENVLNTVRYAEFGIASCNVGDDASTRTGRHLVPFLNTHMPYLQTLHLWRPDDFPWTT